MLTDEFDYDDDDDFNEPMVMLGFPSFDDLIHFIKWVNLNFTEPEDLKEYFEEQYRKQHGSNECSREVAREESDFKFWDIVKNSFKNHHEGPNANIHDTD